MTSHKFIPVAHPYFAGNEKKYVTECLDTMWVSSIGRFIPEFEKAFAGFCEVEHAVACNSGTSAIHLALMAFDVKAGDEVIVPALTYVASANAVRYCGAQPVLVDSEPRTMNLDPAKIESRIGPRTRGIIAVHLYGHPADMGAIMEIARRRKLFVVEDAAEAHGGLCRGRKVGGIGDISAFSFFGNKIITTGEGGMVTTNDPDLARKVRLLRGQGMDPQRRYWFPMIGYNYRMTNIAAAIGLAQMEKAKEHTEARSRVAGWYHRHLAPLADFIDRPVAEPWARHAFWSYTVLLKEQHTANRDALMSALAERGVETRPVFYPTHLMPPYLEPEGSYPVAEDLARRGISLPTHALLTEEDVACVAATLESLLHR
jgi:perosamine synthetase